MHAPALSTPPLPPQPVAPIRLCDDQFPKPCGCCSLVYTAAGWASLPLVGYQPILNEAGTGWGWIEFRNCSCCSTLGVEVAP